MIPQAPLYKPAAAALREHCGKDVIYMFRYDLTADNGFSYCVAALCRDRICSSDSTGSVTEIPVKGMTDVTYVQYVGCAAIECRINGELTELCRTDMKNALAVQTASKQLRALTEGRTLTPRESEETCCPKCGTPYKSGTKTCPICSSKKAVLLRLLPFAKPYKLQLGIAVDADGTVVSVSESGNTYIPDGGYVLSLSSISAGSNIAAKLKVGETAELVRSSPLYTVKRLIVSGRNKTRTGEGNIIYTHDKNTVTPGGDGTYTEIAVNSAGRITGIFAGVSGGTEIPDGGYVISCAGLQSVIADGYAKKYMYAAFDGKQMLRLVDDPVGQYLRLIDESESIRTKISLARDEFLIIKRLTRLKAVSSDCRTTRMSLTATGLQERFCFSRTSQTRRGR